MWLCWAQPCYCIAQNEVRKNPCLLPNHHHIMKKNLYLISALFLVGTGLKAQPVIAPGASPDWKLGSNTNPMSNVIGTFWNPTGIQSQMWFTTGASLPQYRMTIFGGGVTDGDGFIGMGNNLPAAFIPQARLHLHQTGGSVIQRFSNNITGATSSDGFAIGIRNTGHAVYMTHEQGQPHSFFTNDGSATGGFFERMRINAFSDNGFIGMGNATAFIALSQLHINTIAANMVNPASAGEMFRTEGLNTLDNSWRLITGPAIGATSEKGRLFASPSGTAHAVLAPFYAPSQYFNLDAPEADMVFHANGTRAIGSPLQERMRITSEDNFNGTGIDVTRIGITHDNTGSVADPRAMLHIGMPFAGPTNSRGHRQWMDIGTYYGNTNSDMMYVGHQNNLPGQNNSVIAYGSEPAIFNNPAGTGDRMFFRFINDPTLGNAASGSNGLEMARMVSDGNNGRMSIGNPAIGPVDPGNTLEIISSAASPQPAGLRFRNLNCFSPTTPLCDPTNPVYLSVDANGDVILAPGTSSAPGCCLGNLCFTAPNPLGGDYEIPMNNFNFSFTDPGGALNDGQNFVQIGGSCGTPRAKLDVNRINTNNSQPIVYGTYFENQDLAFSTSLSGSAYASYAVSNNKNSNNYGFFGEAIQAVSNTGVMGVAQNPFMGPLNVQNTGVEGRAAEGQFNTGVQGSANTSDPGSIGQVGGNFSASNSAPSLSTNYGIQSNAFNSTTTTDNVGVLSYAYNFSSVTNNVGVAGISYDFGASAANDIGVYGESMFGFAAYDAGPVASGPAIIFSDRKLKQDVKTVENATELLSKLNPVTYKYDTEKYPFMGKASQMQYGFIAQEVQQSIPELVTEANKPEFKDKDGKVVSKGEELIGINYDGIIPILTKSLQEQVSEIDMLKKELAELKEMMKAQGRNQETGNHTGTIELSDHPSIVLDQNMPNPFAEQTTINYVLPENVVRAQMLFYNSDGKLINSMELTERGKGSLNVFANDLSNGIYTYTLVVDGKVVDSKRMIRNK